MARTNFATNPSFEAAVWSAISNGQAGSSSSVSTTQAKFGTHSAKLVNTGTNADDCYMATQLTGLTVGATYKISGYRYIESKTAAAKGNRAIFAYATGVTNITEVDDTVYTLSQWVRFSLSINTGTGSTLDIRLYAVPGTTYWDGILVEQSSNLGNYFDGSSLLTGETYAWTGATNASTSTETPVSFNAPNLLVMF